MEKLALFGGDKVIQTSPRNYNPIGKEEVDAAKEVIESGVLSKYIGAWHEDFLGGPKVKEFEENICHFFDVKYAVTVNSWTSGLVAAVGAIGTEPGDEIIVTPWTMAASATAILHWNAIPVFSDINPLTYNLCINSIEKNISANTRAIIVADIFGLPADIDNIMQLAKEYGLKVISDTAQSPGARYKNRWAGTSAHIGGYSLNYHKHIHTGEGGILVTNDDELADNLRLIRNHAEVVVAGKKRKDIVNMVGHNFRLGEIECAIGIEQLKKLPELLRSRQALADKLTKGINNLPGLLGPTIPKDITHSFYVYPLQIDDRLIRVPRERICAALKAEGVSIIEGYQNIHLLPIYQQKIAFGSSGFPWTSDICSRDISYEKGICPNAEKLHDKTFFGIPMCEYDYSDEDINLILRAFYKVWEQLDSL